MDQETNTGGGPYVEGDANTGGGDFVGRDKNTKSNEVGNVVVNVNQARRSDDDEEEEYYERRERRGVLMPYVEQELRAEIKSLTVAVVRLEASVDKNSAVAAEQIKMIREQTESLEKKFYDRLVGIPLVTPPVSLPRWAGYASLVFLGLIAILLLVLVLWVTKGGF